MLFVHIFNEQSVFPYRLTKLCQILLYINPPCFQDVMQNMGNETVREDFLGGRDGAAQVTNDELTRLDELYPILAPKREDGTPFAQQVFIIDLEKSLEK